jgi:acyl dehydratase
MQDPVSLVLEKPQLLKEFIGREIALTKWFAITQERIQHFADVTEDRQWIHLDRKRAHRESPYRATIAHGFLTLSLLSRFMSEALQIRGGVRMTINYGFNRVRFPAPVRANSKVRARFALRSLRELPDALEAVFEVTVESLNKEKPCCVAQWVVRYYS